MKKSTVEEIRARFDGDVERFSNLDTGQVAAMDSPVHMELVASAAAAVSGPMLIRDCKAGASGVSEGGGGVLDIGCGAGNYTLKLLEQLDKLGVKPRVSLIDLSKPMLDRAVLRISEAIGQSPETINAMQGDVREVELGEARYDIVMAAQCLHHLREDAEWEAVFAKIFRSLKPGGSFWIADAVVHDMPAVQSMMWARWGAYLAEVKDEAYRDHVMAYVEKEDTPRSLAYQMGLMQSVGFVAVDVLQKRSKFASFGGVKPG